jgi:hypothetical protein
VRAFFENTFGDVLDNIDKIVKEIEKQFTALFGKFKDMKIFGQPLIEDPSGVLAQGGGAGGLLPPPETKRPQWPYRTPRFPMPSAGAVPDLAGEYGRAIREMLGPQGLPGGMIYGGAQGTGGGLGGPSIADNIGRIADNTKTAADALTLRRETLGGGQLGQMGVTAAEMAVGGGGGIRMGDFMGGGNRGLIPAGTELERAVRSVIRDEARRNGTPGIMKRF